MIVGVICGACLIGPLQRWVISLLFDDLLTISCPFYHCGNALPDYTVSSSHSTSYSSPSYYLLLGTSSKSHPGLFSFSTNSPSVVPPPVLTE